MSNRNPNEFLEKAKRVVSEETGIEEEDLYIVWFSKTLQNWKALVSTDELEDQYYEVTYNGTRRETYFDHYVKVNNVCVKDDGE